MKKLANPKCLKDTCICINYWDAYLRLLDNPTEQTLQRVSLITNTFREGIIYAKHT